MPGRVLRARTHFLYLFVYFRVYLFRVVGGQGARQSPSPQAGVRSPLWRRCRGDESSCRRPWLSRGSARGTAGAVFANSRHTAAARACRGPPHPGTLPREATRTRRATLPFPAACPGAAPDGRAARRCSPRALPGGLCLSRIYGRRSAAGADLSSSVRGDECCYLNALPAQALCFRFSKSSRVPRGRPLLPGCET